MLTEPKWTPLLKVVPLLLMVLLTSCATPRSPYRYGIPVPTDGDITTTAPAEFENAENSDDNVLVSSMTAVVAGTLALDGFLTGLMSGGIFRHQFPAYWRLSLSVANGSDEPIAFGPEHVTVHYGDSSLAVPRESEHLAARNRATAADRRGYALMSINPLQAVLLGVMGALERKATADMSEEMFTTYLVPEIVSPGSKHGGYVYFPFGTMGTKGHYSLPEDLPKNPNLVARVVVGSEIHKLTFRVDLLSDDAEDHPPNPVN